MKAKKRPLNNTPRPKAPDNAAYPFQRECKIGQRKAKKVGTTVRERKRERASEEERARASERARERERERERGVENSEYNTHRACSECRGCRRRGVKVPVLIPAGATAC